MTQGDIPQRHVSTRALPDPFEVVCHLALVVMTTAGLYETSDKWLYDVGLPGRSGIGGGVVTVAPGKGALATFSALLDAAGNSVRGVLAARFHSRALGLDLLASRAIGSSEGGP